MIELYITQTRTCYPAQGNVEVHLYGRNPEGEEEHIRITGFEPYFYVPKHEADLMEPVDHGDLRRVETDCDTPSLFGDELAKIVATHPGGVPKLKDHYENTFEADVVFTARLRIDYELYTGVRVPSRTVSVDDIEAADVDAPVRYCYYDIEIDDRGTMPVQGGDVIHTESEVITIVAYDTFLEEYHAFISLGERHPKEVMPEVMESGEAPGCIDKLHYSYDEKKMLREWFDWVNESNPDLLLAWNNLGFDAPYLIDRAEAIGMDPSTMARGPQPQVQNGQYDPEISGRVVYDLMKAWKRMQYSDVSAKLDNAASMELGDDAGKIHHEEGIYELWQNNAEKLLRYNGRDVSLMVDIDDAAGIMEDREELKDTVGLDYEQTYEANDFIEMLTRRKLHQWGVAGPTKTPPSGGGDDDYEGALTLEAFEGRERNVTSIDLASLYPFTMWMLNASPETLQQVVDDVDEVTPLDPDEGMAVAPNGAMFDRSEDGLFRALVDDALELTRQAGRRRDQYPAGSEEWENWNQTREARKRIRNGLYGVLGWVWFFLYDEPVAESVTTMAQEVTRTSAEYINANTEGEVVYGDSVPGYEPVTIKRNEEVDVVPIQKLTDYRTKNLEVWNDSGWTGVDSVIEKPNRKQMYRVTTGSGVVHVTEDHGLLRPDGTEVTPDNVEEGDRLLHHEQSIEQFDETEMPKQSEYEPQNDKAWLLGLFVGDGTCGSYDVEHARNSDWKQTKQSWAINNTNNQLLSKASRILEEQWGMGTNVAESMDSSGVKKLQPQSGDSRDPRNSRIRELVTEFRSLCYTDSGKKKVPTEILNGDREAVLSFLSGYQAADGDKSDRYDKVFHRSYTDSHTLAAGINNLLRRLGMEAGIETRDNHDKEYIRIWSRSYSRGDSTKIQSIEKVDYGGESVYDISTENEHFNAGVGTITVHNTDSCYISWPDDWSIERCLEHTADVVDELNNEVYPELATEWGMPADECKWEIEIEDASKTMFQAGKKKRYAKRVVWKEGMDFDQRLDDEEISIKGFETKRSDSAPLLTELQKDVLKMIVKDKPKSEIRQRVFEAGQDIERRYPDWDLIGIPGGIGQSLDEYDSDTAQVRAAKAGNELFDLGIGQGDKPQRVYLEEKTINHDDRSVRTDVIGFENGNDIEAVEDQLYVDVGRMREVVIKRPMSRILDPLGIDIEAALTGTRQGAIADYL